MSIPEPKVEHHARCGIRSCRIVSELLPIFDEAFEIFGEKSEYVVAAPHNRAVANTAMGWKNSNLRTEIRKPRDSPRVFMRISWGQSPSIYAYFASDFLAQYRE